MPNSSTVRFKVGLKEHVFVASRPEILAVLQNAEVMAWGWYLTFHGSEAALVRAGIATADMFADMGKSTQRSRDDEFGNRYTVMRRRGEWDLHLKLDAKGTYALPTDEQPRKCAWWVKHGGEAEAATAAILARFARPSK
jgi:hypothetical protein